MAGLKKVWLPMRSPVMRPVGAAYPPPTLFQRIPGEGMGGLGDNYELATDVRPRGDTVWNDLWRLGVTGSLSRVSPYGRGAFGQEAEQPNLMQRIGSVLPLLVPMTLVAAVMFLVTASGDRMRNPGKKGVPWRRVIRRKGHWRRLPSGKRVRVKPCKVYGKPVWI